MLRPFAVTALVTKGPSGNISSALCRFNRPVLWDKRWRLRRKALRSPERLQRRPQRLQLLLCTWIYWWVFCVRACVCVLEWHCVYRMEVSARCLFSLSPPFLWKEITVRSKWMNVWAGRVKMEAPASTSSTRSAASVPPESQVFSSTSFCGRCGYAVIRFTRGKHLDT